VKSLAESFYTDDINRPRTKTLPSLLEDSNETIPSQLVVTINTWSKLIHFIFRRANQAPPITEIWLNVKTKE
jgi:hypothetical protein